MTTSEALQTDLVSSGRSALPPVGDPALADIAARLKRETAPEHAAIEAASGILHQGLTRAEYRKYLERWFGFLAPLEAELHRTKVWDALGLDPDERRKRQRLESDLRALGSTVCALPLSGLPELRGLPEAIGGAARADTVVAFMALANLDGLAEGLIDAGRDAGTPAAAIAAGTTGDQRTVVSSLAALAADVRAAGLRAPVLVVVGEVVTLQARLARGHAPAAMRALVE